tara:strand:- start:19991 stop:20695 length:705 start_codon:yes stop_codon:yes gene_type:complete
MSEIEQEHELLKSVAIKQNCTASSLEGGQVSVHKLPETTSFSNIEALVKVTQRLTYIGTSGSELVFSAHLNPKEDEECTHSSKKRRRTHAEEDGCDVAAARMRLSRSVPDLNSQELDVAEQVLNRLVTDMRGPGGEVVVQSYAMLSKKLGSTESRQRVVVAARLNAGIAIRVDLLKRCMGQCWSDGLITTLPTLHGIGQLELPLSEEASASSFFGNSAILLVTSISDKNDVKIN